MSIANIVLLIVGVIITLIGVGAFLNPNFARWINTPGGPRFKSAISLIVGIIIMFLSFTILLSQ